MLVLSDTVSMSKGKGGYKFEVPELVKQSKSGRIALVVELPVYPPDRRLCVKTDLEAYLEPHCKVSKDTFTRWIKTVMTHSGIHTRLFRAHSTSSATTSMAAHAGLPTDDILRAAGWSTEMTFVKYYNKPIQKTVSFGHCVSRHPLDGGF